MTKEQFLEKYNGKAVWCKTEELAKEFLKEASMFGFKWYPKDELTKYSNYHYYNNETCYFVHKIDFTVRYESLGYAKDRGYEIIEYKPEEQEEKPKNLIPLIAKMLGVEIGEEFKMSNTPYEYVYKFTKDGLIGIYGDFTYEPYCEFYELMSGKEKIIKLPQKPKLTEAEKVILENLPKEYKWIARDNSGKLCVYENKPQKDCINFNCWSSKRGDVHWLVFSDLFQFIKWEDDNAYKIEELLKGE